MLSIKDTLTLLINYLKSQEIEKQKPINKEHLLIPFTKSLKGHLYKLELKSSGKEVFNKYSTLDFNSNEWVDRVS